MMAPPYVVPRVWGEVGYCGITKGVVDAIISHEVPTMITSNEATANSPAGERLSWSPGREYRSDCDLCWRQIAKDWRGVGDQGEILRSAEQQMEAENWNERIDDERALFRSCSWRRGAVYWRRAIVVWGLMSEGNLLYRGSDDDLPFIPAPWCFKIQTGAKCR